MKALFLFLTLAITLTKISAQNLGPKFVVEITGADDKETEIINNYTFSSEFSDKQALDIELDSLSKQFLFLGYFDVGRTIIKKSDTLYKVNFSLGNKYESLQLYIPKNKELELYIEQSGFTIKNDSIEIKIAFTKAYLNQLTTIASNNGDPFATTRITNISKKNSTTLLGDLILLSQKKRKITKLEIQGYDKFPRGYLKHYTRKINGSTYSQEKIVEQSRNIASLSFIKESKPPEILFTKDSTSLFLYLEKQNTNRFDGFLGFETNENNDFRLNGYLDLELNNNLNFGESLIINYKSDGGDQSQLKIQARLPYILKTPIGIEMALSLFRKDSTFSTNQQRVQLFYQIDSRNTSSLGYSKASSEDLREVIVNESAVSISNFNSSTYSIAHSYKERNLHYFFPIKTEANLLLTSGYREIGSDRIRQTSISLEANYLFEVNSKNFLYVNSGTKYLISPSYITNELFRFGGIRSIRGFEENSLFANFYSILNTEYRHLLSDGLYINSIFDIGYLENQIAMDNNTLLSAGIGAGIRTRAGILKINIVNGKFKNQIFRFSNTKLHLILAARF